MPGSSTVAGSDSAAAGGATGLFTRLVDDAGLFPPTRLPMADAIARHREDQRVAHWMLTQRFLCPVSRVPELRGVLEENDRVRLGLIADGGVDTLPETLAGARGDPRLEPALLEVPCLDSVNDISSAADRARETAVTMSELVDTSGVSVFLEPQRGPGWLDAVGAVAGVRGVGLKVRCGGVRAELFPSSSELAAFVVACAEAGVPFKATAGLHHATRYRDPATGFVHHGFVNLLVAVAAAVSDGNRDAVADVLNVSDPFELVARVHELDPATARRARELFVSYGSCSTAEPVDDVSALGLVGKER